MKKLIYCALALAAGLFATSCQQELLETAGGNTVTFTVQMPTVATKATIGNDASSINDLVYAVYRTTADDLETTLGDWGNCASLVYQKNPSETVFTDNFSTSVSLELINNQNYVILFWAQNSDVWVSGDNFDLTNITYPADSEGNMVVNRNVADKYAAFSAVRFLGANDFAGQKKVELTRPFAQINIAAADPKNYDVVVNSASMTVGAAGDMFNVAKQEAASTKESLSYTWENIPGTDGFTAGEVTYEHYVAMGYVFANGNVSVSYDINTADHGTVTNTISNVPVEENYRTNIVGKLLTSTADYEVTLDKAWGDTELAPDALHLAAAIGGEVTLTEDVVLTSPLVVNSEMTINLNGKTISGEYHKSVGAIIKNNGLLTIIGGTIKSEGENGGSAVLNNGTMIIENVTLNGAPNANGSWPSYTVNNTGELTIINSTITSHHGAVASYGEGAIVNLNNSTIDMAGIPGFTSHGIYTYENGKVIVNGGEIANNATDQEASGASVINGDVEVNAGDISGRIENYYGTPVLKGGSYTVKPNENFIADGYKAIAKDGKYYVVTDNTVSSSEELKNAIEDAAEGDKIMLLDGVTYTIDNYKAGVTIIGAGENVTLDIQDKIYTVNGTATIENVKVVFSNNGYKGFQGGVDLNFKECTIEGQPFLYGTKATFEGCTFVQNDPEQYNIWTYAVLEANFIDCVFNCSGKSILVYGEANNLVQNVNFEGCTFNASAPYNGKAAIEIGTSQLTTGMYNVTINDTDVNNFANGSVSGNPVWNVKNGNRANVIVDGEVCTVGDAEKVSDGLWKSGTTYSVTNAEGLASINTLMVNNTAGVGITINLLSDIDYTGKTWTPVRSHIDWNSTMNEFNGNGYTIENLTINGAAMFTIFSNTHDVVVKDVTFDKATVTNTGINSAIIVGQTYNNLLLENVDVKNSAITGNYKVAALVGTVYNESTSTITATLKGCDVTNTTVTSTQYDFCTAGMVSFVYEGDNDRIQFENCTVKDVKLYANSNGYSSHAAIYVNDADTDDCFNEADGVTVTNVTFEAL